MSLRSAKPSELFSRHPLFQGDASTGAIRRTDGARVAPFSGELLHALHVALIENSAEFAQDALYRSGYEWALQEMIQVNTRLQSKSTGSKPPIWQTETAAALELWWSGFADAGWGTCSFDFSAFAPDKGFMLAEVKNSALAAALVGAEQPMCHLYAGLFAGALSFRQRAERHAVELQCAALGHPSCVFLVGQGETIDRAEGWRQQGVATVEIVRQLR